MYSCDESPASPHPSDWTSSSGSEYHTDEDGDEFESESESDYVVEALPNMAALELLVALVRSAIYLFVRLYA
jgi:hypothetical protein